MRWLAIILLSTFLHAADLASIAQEPNLEKRSQLAVDYAGDALDAAGKQYRNGDTATAEESLRGVAAAVELAYQSLLDTHKEARRSPKFFKRTELATRELLRRIDGLAASMSYQDRPVAEKVRERVSAVHDNLLQAIMKRK